MFSRPPRLRALLFLALALHFAVTSAFHLQFLDRRQNSPDVSKAGPNPTAGSPAPSARGPEAVFAESAQSSQNAPSRTASPTASASSTDDGSSSSASQTSSDTSASPSATNDPANPNFLNATIPEGQLPLTPEITPGWGVAGTVMLLTGLTYTLVGIKNRWIHTFFSTAYVTALGVAVLITYVMTVPVSHSVQGGYVVAATMSGCAVGAASLFFKELTEGLGCALGGFSAAMWLLCLVPGGLLRSVPGKAIFISAFTLVSFGFYFSRWTRDWALIIAIAFSGATVTVLGLDCFTRAGLKEFWAYIWDVNTNLFPLGADTYPVTKGIRVEVAAIIIIFLVGIISQIKLWRIVREKREKRALERAEGQRNLEIEEENVGRQIEAANARERRQWERVYGDGLAENGNDSHPSDLGDMSSEKKLRHSGIISCKMRSSVDVATMSESDLSRNGLNGLMAAEETKDGKMTVRVGVDDTIQPPNYSADEMVENGMVMADGYMTPTQIKRLSQKPPTCRIVSPEPVTTEAPEVVPLPFNVPAQQDSPTEEDDRSSIATFAADDAEQVPTKQNHRHSMIIKNTSRASPPPAENVPVQGLEALALRDLERRQTDDGSLAATMDLESLSGDGGYSASGAEDRVHDRDESRANLHKQEDTESGHDGSEAPKDSAVVNSPGNPKSTTSAASSPVSLTKDRLPRTMSRVAMSYRTNEWAKHLSYADAPDLDEICLAEPVEPAEDAKTEREKAIPVNVAELQKAAHEGAPEPQFSRSESRLSMASFAPSISQRAPKREPSYGATSQDRSPPSRSPPGAPTMGRLRSSSSTLARRTSSGFKPIFEDRPTATAEPIPEEDGAILMRQPSISPSGSGNDLTGPSSPPAAIPGVVSFNSPQTLPGQRDKFLRSKSQGNLMGNAQDMPLGAAGDRTSFYGSPMMASDPDDLPLSQRKEIMRHSSMMSLTQQPVASQSRLSGIGFESSNDLTFNSHQPKRLSGLPSQTFRDAQLAGFRMSVQQDLRSGTPVMGNSGRETPFAPTTMLGNREAEVQRNIEVQRHVLLGQKEAEANRRESMRRDRALADMAFNERMRSGDLLETHREMMRKMQQGAR